MLKRVQGVGRCLGGQISAGAVSPADRLLDAACENARTLSKLCDVIEAGPARVRPALESIDSGAPDGAFILPEEL